MENSKPAFASADAQLIKTCVQYYIQNGPFLTEADKQKFTALFHRMGRLNNGSVLRETDINGRNVLREPAESPDAPFLRETLFD